MDAAQSLFAPISSCFKFLLILTSAMFAVAQYYDGRQRKLMSTDHESIWSFELKDLESNLGMRVVKDEFDRLTNIEPTDNQKVIIVLWALLFFYTALLMVMLIDSFWSDNLRTSLSNIYLLILTASSVYLFVVSGWLTINLMRMKTQLQDYRKDVKAFKKLHEAVTNASAGN